VVELIKSKRMIILAIIVSILTILAVSASVLMNTKNTGPPNNAPTATFTGPTSGYAGENLTFNASLSNDSDGNIASYSWSFGDGQLVNITNPIISHIFSTNGSFNISLTVIDDEGSPSETESTIIEVLPAPPVLTAWLSPKWIWTAKDHYAKIYAYASFKGNLLSPAINVSYSIYFTVNCKWANNSDQLGDLKRGRTSADLGNSTCYFFFKAAAQGRSTLDFSFHYFDPISSSEFYVNKSIPITVTAY